MENSLTAAVISLLCVFVHTSDGGKINTPRVLLPWFEDLNVNFTFEIFEGGCYTWSLSRDDIIDLVPLYDDSFGHCSRAARVSVSKKCVSPGSVIILAEESGTAEILRGDVDIDKISTIKVVSTTWKLYLEEAPEAFEVVAYDDQGNKFSSLEGISFTWRIENLGNTVDEDPLVKLVRWSDTDYEAPRGVAQLEAIGFQSHSVLLYGQAIGDSRVTVCLDNICTDFTLQVVASVVLTPASAIIAPEDTLRYRIVRARAGRLTVEDISDTLYHMKVPDTNIAILEDTISLIRATEVGITNVHLMSGVTEVASAILTVAEPHSIRVILRPSSFLIRGEPFIVHSILLDKNGRAMFAGDKILIRLTVEGEANVDLLRSTENGTLTDAVANNAGVFTVTARLHSIAGKILYRKVEGQISADVVDPLEIVPPELFVAETDDIQEIQLEYKGGGNEPVTWSEVENEMMHVPLSATGQGVVTVRGAGSLTVSVHLDRYPHVRAVGRVWSMEAEIIQVSNSGHARVGRPHHFHVALTATNPESGELFNFHVCDCNAFTVTLLEGPEPYNMTAAKWVEPIAGACCVLQGVWGARGAAAVRVARGAAAHSARVLVRAPPRLVWPPAPSALALLPYASLPVIAEGDALIPVQSDSKITELVHRDGAPPHAYPDAQLFTLKCKKKGESQQSLTCANDEEREAAALEASCAPHVARVRLDLDAPGNCSGGHKVWLRPGQEVSVKVTLMDALGRELLDENGPQMSWNIEPHHKGIEFKATSRLFVEHHPDYLPVPVPYKFYQVVTTEERAIGWNGVLKATIPDASASISARVVAPLKCDPLKTNIAWESETVTNIASVSGGSGQYAVEAPKGVYATVENGVLSASVPGPGSYDLVVTDQCVQHEKQLIEVNIEEVLSVEVVTSRAVGLGACVPVSALVQGVSRRYLSAGAPHYRTAGHVDVRDGALCGLKEGTGKIRASFAGVWSPEYEVLVFPPLEILPSKGQVPPGVRMQLHHYGGPPVHLATLQYRAISGLTHVEVSSSGSVHGLSIGKAKIKLIATDVTGVEMASAESEIEVVAMTEVGVKTSTRTLLVGEPGGAWVQGARLGPGALAALLPAPRAAWALRDPGAARLYAAHADDMLDRSVVEGLSIRVVPLKPGLITIDVRVRNMGQSAETRSWDFTIEILGISDIYTSVEGLSKELGSSSRLAVAVGSVIKLNSLPRGTWKSYEDGAFSISPAGELTAIRSGHGVIVVQHKDERNNIYRETALHVQVSVPAYCTVGPGGAPHEAAVRVTMRDHVGRPLLAPRANLSLLTPLQAHTRPAADSALGSELLIMGLDTAGMLMAFQASASGVTVKDEIWVSGSDLRADRVVVTGGWGVCLEGVGWRSPAGVSIYSGSGVSLAMLVRDSPGTHVLRLDRPQNVYTLHQIPLEKIEFVPGEWPPSMVPLSFTAGGLAAGPLLCSEEQRYALEGAPVELPYSCRTKAPHIAEPVLDIINGQMGCKIIPGIAIKESSEIEVCAEWAVYRACTKVQLLPQIRVSRNKVSLLQPPAAFTVSGHPHALKLVRLTSSPGIKLDTTLDNGEMIVTVKNEAQTCGLGWVTVWSKLTVQEIRVDVERECDTTCGSLLAALLSLLSPYLSTVITVLAVAAAYLYIQARLERKSPIRMPSEASQTVLPPQSPAPSPSPTRPRTWSRSPYAAGGPAGPVYGDASMLPDQSFSPNVTRNSIFL